MKKETEKRAWIPDDGTYNGVGTQGYNKLCNATSPVVPGQ